MQTFWNYVNEPLMEIGRSRSVRDMNGKVRNSEVAEFWWESGT